jgi:putative flippase GtrA
MLESTRTIASAPIRFAVVGTINTLAGLAAIYALKWVFALNDYLANLLGYILGFCISYYLNARWTFSYRGPLAAGLPRFVAVVALAYLANLLVVSIALRGFLWNSYLAHASGVLPYAVVTYLGTRLFVFPANSVDVSGDK